MAISTRGALINSYKHFFIAVDSFENRLLKGRMFHESMEEAAAFSCLTELVVTLERLFDKLQYPMKSVQQRSFNRKLTEAFPGEIPHQIRNTGKDRKGTLSNFLLQVKYRFYASWQGEVTDLSDGSGISFASLIELMDYLGERLGGIDRERGAGCSRQVGSSSGLCDGRYVVEGNPASPAVEGLPVFVNGYQIKEVIESMAMPFLKGEMNHMIPITLQVAAEGVEFETFIVRVLFKRNGTWQGTIGWREKRIQVSFRSFLEILLLIHEAVNQRELCFGIEADQSNSEI
ncbi:MAG: hypothetical protein E7F15_08375 [Clostridiales bacterium]|nr:hypothetical protein [Clostridiales bacterium]